MSHPGSQATPLFAHWLAHGGPFDALLAQHPEHVDDLTGLHAAWLQFEPILRLAGLPVASFAERLSSLHGAGADPEISLDTTPPAPPGTPHELVALLTPPRAGTRYRLEAELARGGMGAILRVWDQDIRRYLAMKVILGRGHSPSTGDTPGAESARVARFLEEAQVTGQLDHPGIVPVHELGLDGEGRVYFTMKLVRGRDLRAIFDLVFQESEGWSQTRALGVLLRVCEAVAYAHRKGVVHRDLKPANVMVGDFGEVYVMDWGLARVVGRADQHDVRPAAEHLVSSSIRTQRRDEREDAPDSPILTMDGDIVGTPAYMPPEQALGHIEDIGPHSDVYSIGAMLYHLVAAHPPYLPPGARATARTLLLRVQEGPPRPLSEWGRRAPPELLAIVEKAMAREIRERYADTSALARDLRAFLERRVVEAYETGFWAETRKWVARNRLVAGLFLATIVCLAGGLAASLHFKRLSDEQALIASAKTQETQNHLDRVEAQRARLREMTDGFIPRVQDAGGLKVQRRSAWGATPAIEDRMSKMAPITRLTIHHEGGASSASPEIDAAATLRGIQSAHMSGERSWGDIGFHYAIDPTGTVWEGRSREFQGAHSGGANNVANLGIVMLGSFQQENPTPQQIVSVLLLVNQLREELGIPADGVLFHSDLLDTECPGEQARELLLRLNLRGE